MPDLLLEIGCEEIPASYLKPGSAAIAGALARAFEAARIAAPAPTVLYTPRRIAIHFANLPEAGEPLVEERTGPAARIAFDAAGQPTKAALGFARSAGVDPSALRRIATDKGEYVAATVRAPGAPVPEVVAASLSGALAAAQFPKWMRWSGSPEPFARPIRRLVALFGGEVVPAAAAGLVAGRETAGHPFLAPEPFPLADASRSGYVEALRARKVLVDPAERRERIRAGLAEFLGPKRAAEASPALLDETTNLAEWPNVIEGRIDPAFLELPAEVLVVAMRVHLRFFPVAGENGALEPRFLAVMNRDPASADVVRDGNETVLRARLTDARFFFHADRERPLEAFVGSLADKALHRDLGNYLDKTKRLEALVDWLAAELSAPPDVARAARRAARLAKADLATQMVGEFPELQGVVGRIYATLDGEADATAGAIEDHYRPRGPEDAPPRGPAAVLVAVAEKLDVLAAFFSIGGAPTGSADPFGLRRQALGLVRIGLECGVAFSLARALDRALELLAADRPAERRDEILAYLRDRLYQAEIDAGERYDLVRAALAVGFDDLPDFRARLAAVTALAADPAWPRLVEIVERTRNIVRAAGTAGALDPALLVEPEERRLHEVLCTSGPEIETLIDRGEYEAAGRKFAADFADVVHEFFAKVFVNVEDPALKACRIGLLERVNALFAARTADLAGLGKGA